MMAVKGNCVKGLRRALVIFAQLPLVTVALAQDEAVNGAPPGGSLLVLLMGLGAILPRRPHPLSCANDWAVQIFSENGAP